VGRHGASPAPEKMREKKRRSRHRGVELGDGRRRGEADELMGWGAGEGTVAPSED
jgi:hypothetical protein